MTWLPHKSYNHSLDSSEALRRKNGYSQPPALGRNKQYGPVKLTRHYTAGNTNRNHFKSFSAQKKSHYLAWWKVTFTSNFISSLSKKQLTLEFSIATTHPQGVGTLFDYLAGWNEYQAHSSQMYLLKKDGEVVHLKYPKGHK